MQENSENKKPLHPIVRALALIAALVVLFVSVWVFIQPGLDKSRNAANTPSFSLLSQARAETFKTLKKGMSGQQIQEMQAVLQALEYYSGPLDGNFSKVLESAVKAFQADFDLEQTGKIDEDTYLLLIADLPSSLPDATSQQQNGQGAFVTEGEWYSDLDHVVAYLIAYDELPDNYLTKKEAQALGWISSEGNLWDVAPGMSIGGDRFGNYEGLLPEKNGRTYTECDIDYEGGYRNNGKRLVFSNDGLFFYTEDHYDSFEEIKE